MYFAAPTFTYLVMLWASVFTTSIYCQLVFSVWQPYCCLSWGTSVGVSSCVPYLLVVCGLCSILCTAATFVGGFSLPRVFSSIADFGTSNHQLRVLYSCIIIILKASLAPKYTYCNSCATSWGNSIWCWVLCVRIWRLCKSERELVLSVYIFVLLLVTPIFPSCLLLLHLLLHPYLLMQQLVDSIPITSIADIPWCYTNSWRWYARTKFMFAPMHKSTTRTTRTVYYLCIHASFYSNCQSKTVLNFVSAPTVNMNQLS